MNFDDLSPEMQEKAKACKTAGEFAALAKEAGIELSDEQLDTLAGGVEWGGCEGKCFDCSYHFEPGLD